MKAFPKTLTHLTAAGIGAVLALFAPGLFPHSNKGTSSDPTTTSALSNSTPDAAARKPGTTAPAGGRAAEFQRAWTVLSTRAMPLEERKKMQAQILKEWAKVDMRGALEAALGEAWDEWLPDIAYPETKRHPLSPAFLEAFKERPLEAWNLLSSGKLGPGSHLLLKEWVFIVGRSDGPLMVSMLPEIPSSLRADAIRESMGGVSMLFKPEQREALLKKIATTGTPGQSAKWLQYAYSQFPEKTKDSATLRERWVDAPAGSDRMIAMTAWASSLHGKSSDDFEAEWQKVPEAARGEASKAVISQLTDRPQFTFAAFDHAIEAGEWAYLDQMVQQVGYNLRTTDSRNPEGAPKAAAEWALKLPDRPEAIELFQYAIEGYLTHKPEEGRALLDALPEGDWHRERGLVELAKRYLMNDDKEGYRRTAEAITDPAARRLSQEFRYDWELRTNRPITR